MLLPLHFILNDCLLFLYGRGQPRVVVSDRKKLTDQIYCLSFTQVAFDCTLLSAFFDTATPIEWAKLASLYFLRMLRDIAFLYIFATTYS